MIGYGLKETRPGSKGERTRNAVLSSAIYCLSHHGERDTTFQKIADHCKVTQPLVVHYFKRRENIFPAVMDYIFDFTLIETLKQLDKADTARARLNAYIDVSLNFFEQQPDLGNIYIQFYAKAAYDPYYKDLNSKIKLEATARIEKILKQGQQEGIYRNIDTAIAAKVIHNSLTGLILNMLSENSEFKAAALRNELSFFIEAYLSQN